MSSKDGMLQIGEVADRVGLSLRTVRYYEEMGLLTPATRTEGGFRLYSEEEAERLALIKEMKPLGFSVQEMRDLLDARDAVREAPSKRVAKAAEGRLKEFAEAAEERCADLRTQLDRAEDFAQRLRTETARQKG